MIDAIPAHRIPPPVRTITPFAMTVTPCPYRDAGYANRKDYLDSLAEEYGAETVYALASVLPESEDFDGLVSGLEDFAEAYN